MRDKILNLGKAWKLFAEFLGWSGAEIGGVYSHQPHSIEAQVHEFMKLLQIPNVNENIGDIIEEAFGKCGLNGEHLH